MSATLPTSPATGFGPASRVLVRGNRGCAYFDTLNQSVEAYFDKTARLRGRSKQGKGLGIPISKWGKNRRCQLWDTSDELLTMPSIHYR
jgi:hypothetical protein